ncbi:MAG: DEAD/DEAH box helicase, partial [Rhizobiaceae bacterium]|nr:DEAD/DEAH box helicase [Rhizobiaceae bacterium]
HRIGRTARAGREGVAIAFCGPEDVKMLYDIEKLTGLPIPVASGERPEWQGKKKAAGGGSGHRGRRPTGHETRPEAIEAAGEAGAAEPVVKDGRERGGRPRRDERRPQHGRGERRESAFAEVEELNGGEFRPLRKGPRRDDNRERFPGDSRNEFGERQSRHEQRVDERRPARPDGGKRQGQGRDPQGQHRGQNRHSPARHAGFADDRNINASGGERAPTSENRNHGKPAGSKKRWHGGERRAQSGDRRS